LVHAGRSLVPWRLGLGRPGLCEHFLEADADVGGIGDADLLRLIGKQIALTGLKAKEVRRLFTARFSLFHSRQVQGRSS
jgi:hypothetical protein